MTPYTWKVYKTDNSRFPYRISIEEDGSPVIALRTQDRWPGPQGQIFCLREQSEDDAAFWEPLETVPISYLKRIGKKVEIVLERPRQKRCDFLFLKKAGKDGKMVEQIFFRTQSGLREHRAKGRPLLYGQMKDEAEIVIDSRERYPWRFPNTSVRKAELPVGDYALVTGNRYTAVVERKSFENILRDLYKIQILNHQLKELSTYPNAALVIEAQYGDFTDKSRIGEECTPAYLIKLLAEISALHPAVRIVYAGNRKMANQWTNTFFKAVRKRIAVSSKKASELMEQPISYTDAPVDIGLEVRAVILSELIRSPKGFRMKDLQERFPEADKALLQRTIRKLKDEKKINKRGTGSGSYYVIGPEAPASQI